MKDAVLMGPSDGLGMHYRSSGWWGGVCELHLWEAQILINTIGSQGARKYYVRGSFGTSLVKAQC